MSDDEIRNRVAKHICVNCRTPLEDDGLVRYFCCAECYASFRAKDKRSMHHFKPEYRFECDYCKKIVVVEAGSRDKRTRFCCVECERNFWRHRDNDDKRRSVNQNFSSVGSYVSYEKRPNEHFD